MDVDGESTARFNTLEGQCEDSSRSVGHVKLDHKHSEIWFLIIEFDVGSGDCASNVKLLCEVTLILPVTNGMIQVRLEVRD